MHTDNLQLWTHRHVFGQDRRRTGERRTLLVIALTAATMVLEISIGILFGSMALLADALTPVLAIFALLAGKYLG